MTRRRWRTAVLGLAMIAIGCGYRLAGTGTNMPATARTVSIALFKNRSQEKSLDVALQGAIEEEFRRRGTLEVVPDQGDLVLSGSILRFWSNPIAFNGTLVATQFQSNLLVSLKLTERATGRVLYDNPALQESTDFGAVTGTVVSASPRFQDQTINARDLVNLTNVQIGESRRRTAISELVGLVAHEVYVFSVEAF
jgi:lipopolysaccharide assembly LptE-like protein